MYAKRLALHQGPLRCQIGFGELISFAELMDKMFVAMLRTAAMRRSFHCFYLGKDSVMQTQVEIRMYSQATSHALVLVMLCQQDEVTFLRHAEKLRSYGDTDVGFGHQPQLRTNRSLLSVPADAGAQSTRIFWVQWFAQVTKRPRSSDKPQNS